MRTLPLMALCLLLRDEKDDLKKAHEKTAALKSYFTQWTEEVSLTGNARPQSGAGEYVAPDLVTYRTGIVEIIKKGDKAMCKGKDGWVKAEEDRRSKPIAAALRPAHEDVKRVLDAIEKPKKGKDAEHQKIKCKVIAGALSGDTLKEIVGTNNRNLGTLARAIDWTSSSGKAEVFIDSKNGWLVKVAVDGTLKAVSFGGQGGRDVPYKRVVEFLEHDKAKPSIVPEVRKELGIPEPESDE
jgi:hypothetical protein